jgi:hypothetical protein
MVNLTRLRTTDSAALRAAPAEHRIHLYQDLDHAMQLGREILLLLNRLHELVEEERNKDWDWVAGLRVSLECVLFF